MEKDKNEKYVLVEKPIFNYLAFAGITLIRSEIKEEIENKYLNMTDFFNRCGSSGIKAGFYEFQNYWRDIGTPDSIINTVQDLFGH